MIKEKTHKYMKNTAHKLGESYSYKGAAPSKIVEVRNTKYGNFILLENGDTISVTK